MKSEFFGKLGDFSTLVMPGSNKTVTIMHSIVLTMQIYIFSQILKK